MLYMYVSSVIPLLHYRYCSTWTYLNGNHQRNFRDRDLGKQKTSLRDDKIAAVHNSRAILRNSFRMEFEWTGRKFIFEKIKTDPRRIHRRLKFYSRCCHYRIDEIFEHRVSWVDSEPISIVRNPLKISRVSCAVKVWKKMVKVWKNNLKETRGCRI